MASICPAIRPSWPEGSTRRTVPKKRRTPFMRWNAVVISSEVGMRKPEERIYTHALAQLGLSPGQCVFIDDLEANVAAAQELGMIGVHHRDPDTTAAAVMDLFGLSL